MHAMTVDVAVSGQEQNSTTSNTIAGLAAQMLSGEERDDLLEARRPCAESELLSQRCGRSLSSWKRSTQRWPQPRRSAWRGPEG